MLKIIINSLLKNTKHTNLIYYNSHRCYPAHPKRFYKNTNVLSSNGCYEITLDNIKLKTPSGKPFVVKSEPLAIAISAEWDAQKEIIMRPSMHLTALMNTAIDNVNRLTKLDMINHILNFIPTDTILFQSNEDDDLYKYQCAEWDPLIEWFNKRYDTDMKKNRDILSPVLSDDTKMKVSKFLLSYDDISLHGFTYAVDLLKSLILSFACIDRFITIERAVQLARLEEEFQIKYWGRVEWAHDLSEQDLRARLAASVLFIHFTSTDHLIKQKLQV